MKLIFIIFNLLLLFAMHKTETEDIGPVSAIMENLAINTAQITDEIQWNLSTKFERSAADLLGNIEVITANAMSQLGEAVFQAQTKLPNCPQNWTMDTLFERINAELTKCNGNLFKLRTIFQSESQNMLQGLQTYVAQLSNLPAQCAVLQSSATNSATNSAGSGGSTFSFANSTACFVQLMAQLNRNVSQLVAQANTSLVRTRQSTRGEVKLAMSCSAKVVDETVAFLNEAFEKC